MMASAQPSTPALFATWRAAQDRWDSLLERQEAALEGRGLMPLPGEVRKAQRAAETALAALETRQ